MNYPDLSQTVQDKPAPVGPVLTKTELAERWKVCVRTVERLIENQVRGVKYFRIRGKIRFRLCDIEEFELQHLTRQRPF